MSRPRSVAPSLELIAFTLACAVLTAAGSAEAAPPAALLRAGVDVRGAMLSEGDDQRRGADPTELWAAFGAPVGGALFIGAPVNVQGEGRHYLGLDLGLRSGALRGRADNLPGGPFTYQQRTLSPALGFVNRSKNSELSARIGPSWTRQTTTASEGGPTATGDAFGLSWGAELAWSAPHKGPQRVNLGVFFESDLMAVGGSRQGDLLPYDDGDAAFYAALGLRLSTSRALRPRGARAD